MFAISVVICTRRPREDHFRRVLDALRAQTLPKGQWELLVLSVASDGPLSEVFDLSWHPHARFILEEQAAKTHSMLRGITESQGELLVIVDDDNVLRRDYLENAVRIGIEHPYLGAWGCSYVPEYEIEPPVELRPWLWGLLIEKRTVAVWAKIPRGNWALPPGAGMVVRKKQALYYQEQVLHDPLRLSLGPGDKPPYSGAEDSDLALCAFHLDLGTGMFPDLELTHLIPARKLNLKYLEYLYAAFAYGGKVMEAIHDPEGQYEIKCPGRIQPSALRIFLLQIFMFAKRKSRADRRIILAQERGRMRAQRDLQRLRYCNRSPYINTNTVETESAFSAG